MKEDIIKQRHIIINEKINIRIKLKSQLQL